MQERNDTPQAARAEGSARGKRILFSAVNIAALAVIPLLLLATVLHFLLTSADFYTGIIRHSGFLSAYIESRNWETNRKIQDEVDRTVKLREFNAEFERIREAHAAARQGFDDLNRTREYDYAKKRRKELAGMSWDDVKDMYQSKDGFESFRKAETAKLDSLVGEIEKHRKENRKELKRLEASMDDAQDKLDDAKSALEDKKAQAQKIADRHRSGMGAKIFADFELLEPRLTRLLNDRLVDGALRSAIAACIGFLASYETQRAAGRVFERGDRSAVRLPDLMVSLWVDDDSMGATRKRHLLSDVFVDEISRSNLVQNGGLYATMFRFFDTSLGESIGRSMLGKYGASLQNGVLSMRGITLEGGEAETVRAAMIALTYGKFLPYLLAAAAALYACVLFFSARGATVKRAALRRLCIYPAALVMTAGAALILYAWVPYGFIMPSPADVLLARLGESSARAASLYLCLPVMGAFGLLFACGLALRAFERRARRP